MILHVKNEKNWNSFSFRPFYNMNHVIWSIWYKPYELELLIIAFWDFHKVNRLRTCLPWRFLFAIYLEHSWFDRGSWCYSGSCSCWRCTWSRLWRRTHLGTDSSVWIITRRWGQPWSWCWFYQDFKGLPSSKATKERAKNSQGKFKLHNYLMEPFYISLLAIISFPSNCQFRQTEKSAFEVSKLQLKNLANQNTSRLFHGNILLKL